MPLAETWSKCGWIGQAIVGVILIAFNVTLAVTTYTRFIPLILEAHLQDLEGKDTYSALHHYVSYAYCIAFFPCVVAAYDIWITLGCAYITSRIWAGERRTRRVARFASEVTTMARLLRSVRHIAWFNVGAVSCGLFFIIFQIYEALL